MWYVIRPSFLLAASLEEEEAARPAPASEARPGLSLPLCQKKATLEIGKFSLSLAAARVEAEATPSLSLCSHWT